MSNFYEVLGVEKNATQEEIKKAFKKLSKKHHPDVEGGDTEKFKEINEAYQTLSDESKRFAYDNGTRPIITPPIIVPDIVIRIAWTLANIKNGGTFKFPYDKAVTCPVCNGIGSKTTDAIFVCKTCGGLKHVIHTIRTSMGEMQTLGPCSDCHGRGEINSDPCTHCHGNKQIMVEETIEVTIPPNTVNQFRVKDKGHNVIQGRSDLVLVLTFQDSTGVVYEGGILHKQLKVEFFDALLGKATEVQIGDTKIRVAIPKETKDGKKLKLSKAYCGIDVIVHLVISSPSIEDTSKFIKGLFKGSEIAQKVNEILKTKLK